MVWATWLAEAARTTGYPVIELANWQTRGHGAMRVIEGVVGHHTAGPASGDYPSLNVVRDGRSDLSGPLANLGLGRSGTIYVIAAGTCYHAGVSEYAGFTNLNDEFLGIEAESTGHGDWTPQQLDAYPKLVGALLKRMGRGVDRYVSHRTCARPAGRKPDPTGISDSWMREKAQDFINRLSGGGGTTHTVVYGDTLWSLAQRYHVSVAQLRQWNDLGNSDLIYIGEELVVAEAAPPPPPPSDPGTRRVLGRGDTGDDVKELQRILNAWYGGIAVDGDFGPITEAAVKRVQRNTPPPPVLVADGLCGPLTWKKLGR